MTIAKIRSILVYDIRSSLAARSRVVFNAISVGATATIIAIGVYKVYMWLVAKAAVLGAKLGAVGGLAASLVVGALFGLVIAASGWTIIDALLQGKGLSITWKRTWFGVPYGLELSAE